MSQRAKLIIRDSGLGIGLRAIDLMGPHSKDITGIGIVAGEAVLAAGENPGLSADDAIGAGDQVIVVCAGQKKIRVGVIIAPLISDAIDATGGINHQEA